MSVFEERNERTKGFLNDTFGMFIHWGLYAVPSRGEWVRYHEKISVEEYQKYSMSLILYFLNLRSGQGWQKKLG